MAQGGGEKNVRSMHVTFLCIKIENFYTRFLILLSTHTNSAGHDVGNSRVADVLRHVWHSA